jgi:hypothetical protein
MTTPEQHPITPPLELVEQLQDLGNLDAIQLAYQAGADQELEACCKWLDAQSLHLDGGYLRTDRRPKPPSLKEQAITKLKDIRGSAYPCNYQEDSDWDTILHALEALPND